MFVAHDDEVTALIASTFGIPKQRVVDDLAYGAIPEWDSLNHVNLMLALERLVSKEIDEDLMVALTTVSAIREFVERAGVRQG
jgi:citrate synthase